MVGGGPAGLFAAETASARGARVSLFETHPAPGRKFLVAGYGGLNLTHGEELAPFLSRYRGPELPAWFPELIRAFPPTALRDWAAGLGTETFQQRTGRVYPRAMKAAPLLRSWLARLRAQGVTFFPRHRLREISPGPELHFENQPSQGPFDALILALGGASWPRTGSDGTWTRLLPNLRLSPFQSANCGWEFPWPAELIPHIEGRPLKNIRARAGQTVADGELMLTRYGLEGGLIYQLGPALRAQSSPVLEIDLKPAQSPAVLLRKMESVRRDFLSAAATRWKLPPHTRELLDRLHGPFSSAESLLAQVKKLRLPLTRPRPLAEAISSAGGVAWTELDHSLMLKKHPGIFLAGEMIDWEAPTGGYLLQACFATGRHAARAACEFTRP
ncbi:MAG: NAD(P)/FAD-dependent oxidoreductase [Verrucomicrobiales bacterium]